MLNVGMGICRVSVIVFNENEGAKLRKKELVSKNTQLIAITKTIVHFWRAFDRFG